MSKKLIFGHKNPDTDSICSALVYANLKQQLGEEVEACRLGELNDETKYILDYLNMQAPLLIDDVTGKEVILVDHNEFNQSANGIESATVLEVIDHHRVDNFKTQGQVFMNVQPVGCTNTILFEMFKINKLEISKQIATLMCSAIISDSLLFKSPTCTKRDQEAAMELAEIAGLDIEVYGMEMLKAGTNLSKFSNEELLSIDAKMFETRNGKFEVAQVNTVSIEDFEATFGETITSTIDTRISDESLDMFILLVTDIVNSNSLAIVRGAKNDVFTNAFNKELNNDRALLDGVVPRKKQVVPFL